MPPIVPPLAAAFASLPDYRHARGKRHPLPALLLLACVAMLGGARGPSGIADWAKNHGEPWRGRLGLTHRTGPSQSTMQRLFAQSRSRRWKRSWRIGRSRCLRPSRPRSDSVGRRGNGR